MLEKALIYNHENQGWEICDDADITSKDISILPIAFTMIFKNKNWIWCHQHKNFEEIAGTKGVLFTTVNGCVIKGVPAPFGTKPLDSFEYTPDIPVRWRVFSRSFNQSVSINTDILLLRFTPCTSSIFQCAPVLKNFAFSRHLFSFDERELKTFDSITNNRKLPLPDEISDIAFELMKDKVQEEYGIRPTTETSLEGEQKLKAFFTRPFEINSCMLSSYLPDFDTVVPRDCMDGYKRICEAFSIDPPKGMRKIYPKNPYSLIMYRALRELGFTNYDLIRPFFAGTRIGAIDFENSSEVNFPFLSDSNTISTSEVYSPISGLPSEEYYTEWNRLAFLTKWLMEKKGEKRTARQLLRYSTGPVVTANNDICRMLYSHFDKISEEAKEMFIHNGFSHELHERLVEETNQFEYGDEVLSYFPYERDFECEINGYCFELPETTRDIHQLAKAMQNCVASYTSDAYRKTSTIVSVRKENQFVGCIEVQKRSVVQALGFKNQYFQGELLYVVNYWMHRMMLHDATRYLYCREFYQIPLQTFQRHNLPEKHTFFLYDLNELLDLPEEQIQSGYYRALGAKLFNNLSAFNHNDIKEKYRHLLHDIPMKRMTDEKAYLHAACPALDRIVNAAFQGNGEAQWVLSELYSDGGYFIAIVKANNIRGEYWKKKAEASGEPGFPKLYRFLHAGDLS